MYLLPTKRGLEFIHVCMIDLIKKIKKLSYDLIDFLFKGMLLLWFYYCVAYPKSYLEVFNISVAHS